MLTLVVPRPACAVRAAPGEDVSLQQDVEDEQIGCSPEPIDWSTEAIVKLHMILLDQLSHLADPVTPLEEKLELLQWVYTERDLEDKPFSFANCVKLCGTSLNPHFGLMSADDVRDELARYIPRWLSESLAMYPPWVQRAVRSNPEWVWSRINSNPQFINRATRRSTKHGDLFS